MQQESQNICIGIDLGTTNSEVAIVYKGRPVVLNIDQSAIMPSVVSIDEAGEVLVGAQAVNNELANPNNTVRFIKRKMGRDEALFIAEKNFTPPMISALILKRLKQVAEQFLQQPVTKAVITVPAFFNEKQREATKEAAELAGLEPVRLLNEPTSAALAYSLNKNKKEVCLVYDLGGGTFDVSIVDFSNELMEVKASHGDVSLGGCDFDALIASLAQKQFFSEYSIDLAQNKQSWIRLTRACEIAKIRLSTELSYEILEEFITIDASGKPLHLKFEITRTKFEELIRPHIEKTLDCVRKALEMASLTSQQIDRVILVGGSTYIPLVSELLTKELNITPQAWINPSTVVAMGAAIEAAALSGEPLGPMMVDVTPHSLGIRSLGDKGLYNHILIRRNTPLPCTASQVFYKMHEEQEKIQISVNQGESEILQNNQELGSFTLDSYECDNIQVFVKFELNRSGLLSVTAVDAGSGNKASHTLKRAKKQSFRHANLADLESVRIQKEHVLITDMPGFEPLIEAKFADHEEETSLVSLDDEMLYQRVEALLQNNALNPNDLQELKNEYTLARKGDKEALTKLQDLVYYME